MRVSGVWAGGLGDRDASCTLQRRSPLKNDEDEELSSQWVGMRLPDAGRCEFFTFCSVNVRY